MSAPKTKSISPSPPRMRLSVGGFLVLAILASWSLVFGIGFALLRMIETFDSAAR